MVGVLAAELPEWPEWPALRGANLPQSEGLGPQAWPTR